jgi:hypothetical protein
VAATARSVPLANPATAIVPSDGWYVNGTPPRTGFGSSRAQWSSTTSARQRPPAPHSAGWGTPSRGRSTLTPDSSTSSTTFWTGRSSPPRTATSFQATRTTPRTSTCGKSLTAPAGYRYLDTRRPRRPEHDRRPPGVPDDGGGVDAWQAVKLAEVLRVACNGAPPRWKRAPRNYESPGADLVSGARVESPPLRLGRHPTGRPRGGDPMTSPLPARSPRRIPPLDRMALERPVWGVVVCRHPRHEAWG